MLQLTGYDPLIHGLLKTDEQRPPLIRIDAAVKKEACTFM